MNLPRYLLGAAHHKSCLIWIETKLHHWEKENKSRIARHIKNVRITKNFFDISTNCNKCIVEAKKMLFGRSSVTVCAWVRWGGANNPIGWQRRALNNAQCDITRGRGIFVCEVHILQESQPEWRIRRFLVQIVRNGLQPISKKKKRKKNEYDMQQNGSNMNGGHHPNFEVNINREPGS